jgi:hypothetical protein
MDSWGNFDVLVHFLAFQYRRQSHRREQFLWVGRDRFAQFQKFFASAGLEAPIVADVALIIAAGLEVFAFVFIAGCPDVFFEEQSEEARSWFLMGICFTLATFTVFSLGDHLFGDRFELLEHTLFWFMTLGIVGDFHPA